MDDDAKVRAQRRIRARRRAGGGSPGRREVLLVGRRMVSTTPEIPGWTIGSSAGVVTAEVAHVGDMISNIATDLREGWGGRSGALEALVRRVRTACLEELRAQAWAAGGNALVGVRIDIESPAKHYLLALGTGTAVVVNSVGTGREVEHETQEDEDSADEPEGGSEPPVVE